MASVDVPPPPTTINPYTVLSVPVTATSDEIKTAYKKLALVLHPDKAPPSDRDQAHVKFQELAFAYAILSSPQRRRRYDNTGSTAESLDLDDDDFNWSDFFRAQYAELVTTEKIQDLKKSYQGSEEEKRDVLAAYTKSQGKMGKIFSTVMLSSVLDDEERFRAIIDAAIASGEVEGYDAYLKETQKSKTARKRNAERQAEEAAKHAKDIGVYDTVYGTEKSGKKKDSKSGDLDGLAAMIQAKGRGRADAFLENLEAKYSQPSGKGKKRKSPVDEPDEEAFQAMAERQKRGKAEKAAEASPGKKETTKAKAKASKAPTTKRSAAASKKESASSGRTARGKKAKVVEEEDDDDESDGVSLDDEEDYDEDEDDDDDDEDAYSEEEVSPPPKKRRSGRKGKA